MAADKIEFRAGRLVATRSEAKKNDADEGEAFDVTAIKSRGVVTVELGDVDAVKGESISFAWKERSRRGAGTEGGGVREYAVNLYKSDGASFTRVETPNKKDRVYLLQLASDKKARHFFWMQEPDATKDDETVLGVNKLLGHSVAEKESEEKTSEGGSQQNAVQLDALSSILSSMGLPNSTSDTNAAAPSAASSSGSGSAPLSANDIQQVISGLAGAMRRKRSPSIAEILSPEDITPLLDDPEIQQVLMGLLPEERRTVQELRSVVHSPQMQRAMHVLSSALQSDNFNTIMANFNLDTKAGADALAAGDGIGAFLQALQVDADGGEAASSSKANEDDDDDDDDDGDWYS